MTLFDHLLLEVQMCPVPWKPALSHPGCVVTELWVERLLEVEAPPLVEVLPLVLVGSNIPRKDNQVVDESISNAFIPDSVFQGAEHNIVLHKHVVGVEKTNSSIVVVVECAFLHISFLVANIAICRI